MCSTSCSTDYSAIKLFVLGLAIMKKLLGILVLGLLWCNTVVALDEKTKNDPQMIEYMVKRKINFIDTKPISISEIAGWSHSCDKEDFIKYVGTVEGCIGIKKLGKIDKSKKKLVVYLHGDYKGKGSNNTPKYMAGFSNIIKDQKDNINFFFIARPGHQFPGRLRSAGKYKNY